MNTDKEPFHDGMVLRGTYSVWKRANGRWWTTQGPLSISDDTVEWLLTLDSTVTTTNVDTKISKSAQDKTYTDRIKYRLDRH